MQDLIDKFQQETVPLLCEKWPEKFKRNRECPDVLMVNTVGGYRLLSPDSLDSLAAIAEACGFVTSEVNFGDKDGDKLWISFYAAPGTLGLKRVDWYPTKPEACLAATIAAVAAVGGARAEREEVDL